MAPDKHEENISLAEAKATVAGNTERFPRPEPGETEAPAPTGETLAGVSVTVKPDEGAETFSVTVKHGKGADAETLETFEGLTAETMRERLAKSEYIIVNDDVETKMRDSLTMTKLLRSMAERRGKIHDEFKGLVADAKFDPSTVAPENESEDPDADEAAERERLDLTRRRDVALDKLRVFEKTGNKELGMRLALMNRDQRKRFWGELRGNKQKAERAARVKEKRNKARAARKARRKGRR